MKKLTNRKKLDNIEKERIKAGGWLSFACEPILIILEPDACGYPPDNTLGLEMISNESAQH